MDRVNELCVCGERNWKERHTYTARPPGETIFPIFELKKYQRTIFQCVECKHFISIANVDIDQIYSGAYVDSTYGQKYYATFKKIVSLPDNLSDNVSRVNRINSFVKARIKESGRGESKVLDVGSGLCVFLNRMKEYQWQCTAIDPDFNVYKHAKDVVGVEAIHGDFLSIDISGQFDLVTFNKVLEHVSEPEVFLKKASRLIGPGGWIYVEVPDGARAALDPDGFGREEFFIEHKHVFSEESLLKLTEKAGLKSDLLSFVREPSGKYTLFSFLRLP